MKSLGDDGVDPGSERGGSKFREKKKKLACVVGTSYGCFGGVYSLFLLCVNRFG